MGRILVIDTAGRFYSKNRRFDTYHAHEALVFSNQQEAQAIADLHNATVVRV